MAEAGERCAAIRGGSGAARSPRQARLVQECRTGGTTALGARAPRRLLFSEGAHAERPADRFGSPIPSRQRRAARSEEHTSELQSRQYLVCRLLLEKKKYRGTTRPF